PGFVDALATLLMIIIFLLTVFVLAQVFLSEALSGRDRALDQLRSELGELAQLLSLEKKSNEELRGQVASLSDELQASLGLRDDLSRQLSAMGLRAAAAEDEVARLTGELETTTE